MLQESLLGISKTLRLLMRLQLFGLQKYHYDNLTEEIALAEQL